eukprot:5926376-Alexandrium_andersonii.AAC.1
MCIRDRLQAVDHAPRRAVRSFPHDFTHLPASTSDAEHAALPQVFGLELSTMQGLDRGVRHHFAR